MKKLVSSALALSVLTGGVIASDNEWTTLDHEIEALSSSISLDGGPNIGGRIRTLYASSSDVMKGANSLGDFDVKQARLYVTGERAGYGYKLQVDFASSNILLDAYVDFPVGGQVQGRFGQFKPGFSRSGLISSGKIFFIDRNIIGGLWGDRSEGIMFSGNFEAFAWWLTITDGSDANGDEYLITGKAAFDVMGDGAAGNEGAYGGSEAPSATAAIAFYDDGGTNDNTGTLIEFHGGTNMYSFGVDLLSIGDALAPTNGSVSMSPFAGALQADSTPMSIAGTYMLSPDKWQLGIRYQDYDNTASDTKLDIAAVNHIDGDAVKWTFQISTTSSDVTANEMDWMAIQLQLGF